MLTLTGLVTDAAARLGYVGLAVLCCASGWAAAAAVR